EEVERLDADDRFGAVVGDGGRTRRVEEVEEIDQRNLRPDDEAARGKDDGADVAGRRQAVAAAAVRGHDLDIRPMVGQEEIDVGVRQAALARPALAQEQGAYLAHDWGRSRSPRRTASANARAFRNCPTWYICMSKVSSARSVSVNGPACWR